jgi:hypothetical protein
VDVLSFVRALRRNDKTRVAAQGNRQKREGKEAKREESEKERGEDNNTTMTTTTIIESSPPWQETRAFIPIRHYDTPKRSPRAYLHALRHNNSIRLTHASPFRLEMRPATVACSRGASSAS